MMARICDDTCPNCLYICEGDFLCSLANELVIVEWTPVYGECIKNRRSLLNDKKKKKGNTK